MKRIERLRQTALDHRHCNDEFYYRFYKQYSNSAETSEKRKYADAFYRAFSTLTPKISDGELIVGAIDNGLTDSENREWEEDYQIVAKEACAAAGWGQDSHMAIDYEILLSLGLKGMIARIEEYERECTPAQAEFYFAAKTCLLAIIRHSENYAARAEQLARTEENAARRAELVRIAEVCRRVPAEPAESFYEAVQSVHFVTYCLGLNPLRMNAQIGRAHV